MLYEIMPHFSLTPGYIDSHCHLSDPRIQRNLSAVLMRARNAGITNFALAGVGPEDWGIQEALAKSERGIMPCFGLHPYWVAEHSFSECEAALVELEQKLSKSLGLGECGLDFRSKILGKEEKAAKHHQELLFARQLELAKKNLKVPVLHIVRAHSEAQQILRKVYSGDLRPGLVHSFNSSATLAKSYLDLGFYLSIGGPLLRENNLALHEAVAAMPLDRILLESDSPDQAPPAWERENNEPITILLVAQRVAELKKLTQEEVLRAARENFLRLFHQEIAA